MNRAKLAAFTCLTLWSNAACTSSADDDLMLEEDGGKTDVVRPSGRFVRNTADRAPGLNVLQLADDRTYASKVQDFECELDVTCTSDHAGRFQFATSSGKPHLVLYNEDDSYSAFEYAFDGHALKLRPPESSYFFTMTEIASGLQLDEDDDGGTFQVTEGEDVVLSLRSNPRINLEWRVATTDRTFGYGTPTFEPDAVGGAGTTRFVWHTAGTPLSMVGAHIVKLELNRHNYMDNPPEAVFEITVDVIAR